MGHAGLRCAVAVQAAHICRACWRHPSSWPAAHVLFFDLDGKMDIIRLLEVGSIAAGRAAAACDRSQMMVW